jgi:aryl-alcohol dehydrogenase-like predicted oxidoreductase
VEQRILSDGGSGLGVSALCLGTMHFGTKVDEPAAFAVLDRFVEAGGTVIDTANHADSHRRLAVLADVAKELDATPNQVVLAWLLRSAPPVLPVLGVSSVAQLDECLWALDLDLNDELRHRLDTDG